MSKKLDELIEKYKAIGDDHGWSSCPKVGQVVNDLVALKNTIYPPTFVGGVTIHRLDGPCYVVEGKFFCEGQGVKE